METWKKKALLIVAGGRAAPDFAALECVKPELVVILTTHEGWGEEQNFRLLIPTLPDREPIPETIKVASYSFEETEKQCLKICEVYPLTMWDWTFSIGSCPKIMAIAAYEVARQLEIPCIHVDTQHEKIISLVKNINVSAHDFFNMDVKTYISIYGREPDTMNDERLVYRRIAEGWGHIANLMISSSDTPMFMHYMRDKQAENIPSLLATSGLCQALKGYNAVELHSLSNGIASCKFTNKHFAKFLGTGDWLEVYSWQEAKKAGIMSDCQWGYSIKSSAKNELDVVCTYKAQMIFAECKTDGKPFNTKYLETINSKAEMLGRNYVTKIFVTNASNTLPTYKNFAEQAKLRRIAIATAENLPSLSDFFRKQAKNPDYPRL
jgi:hypothetical protein